MTPYNRKGVLPRLRFPEFREAPPWSIEPLGRLFCERQETGFPELPLLSVTDRDGVIPQEETNRKDNSNSNKAKYLRVVPGDIAYNTMRMWEGRSARVGLEGLISPAYTVCQPRAGTNSDFFAYYFKTRPLIEQFRKYSQGLVKDTLNLKYGAFSRIPVGCPRLDEQEKIAECVGLLDDLIAAEGLKRDALRRHKQGLMQQLFPQAGEPMPRLRFPEFHSAGEWKKEKLDTLAKRGTGHTPNKGRAEYYNGGIKWVSLADSKRLDNGLIAETAIAISEEGVKNSSAVVHPAGSVVLSRDAGVGKSAIIGGPMAVSQHFIVWTCRPSALLNWFLYHQLQLLKPLFEQIATGSTIKTIGLPFFSALRITVPPRLAEQERIADCLCSLDARLAAQVRKLESLEQHKRSVLQQLFPSPDGQWS